MAATPWPGAAQQGNTSSTGGSDKVKNVQKQADAVADLARENIKVSRSYNCQLQSATVRVQWLTHCILLFGSFNMTQMSLNQLERLEVMEEKAAELETQGREFHRGAVKVRRKFCYGELSNECSSDC